MAQRFGNISASDNATGAIAASGSVASLAAVFGSDSPPAGRYGSPSPLLGMYRVRPAAVVLNDGATSIFAGDIRLPVSESSRYVTREESISSRVPAHAPDVSISRNGAENKAKVDWLNVTFFYPDESLKGDDDMDDEPMDSARYMGRLTDLKLKLQVQHFKMLFLGVVMSVIYSHLSAEERAAIMLGRKSGHSLRFISTQICRSVSTVSREIKRCAMIDYDATCAGKMYMSRRRNCRRKPSLVFGSDLYRYVYNRLCLRWSPQQISNRLHMMPAKNRLGLVSHETIYAAIYAQPRGSLKKGMLQDMRACLRQEKIKRGVRRKTPASKGGFVPELQRIAHRPEDINNRLIPGHWEGDFIKGAFNRSGVGVLVERKTRYVVLCKMNGCKSSDALVGFERQMKKLPAFLRKSMTYDRGSEMACHALLSKCLNIEIWFCDPHAPWQRGSNENTNGLLRQFLPKGIDLSTFSQTKLNDIACLMNGRPRQTLGWKTPDEVMTEQIKQFSQTVALDF